MVKSSAVVHHGAVEDRPGRGAVGEVQRRGVRRCLVEGWWCDVTNLWCQKASVVKNKGLGDVSFIL